MRSRLAERPGSIIGRSAVGLIALPPLLIALLVVCYWVNVPLFDEWSSPGALFKEVFVNGHFRWHDLVVQHNESRLVVFRLLSLALAWMVGWDTRVPMALTWVLAVAILFALGRLLRATVPSPPSRIVLLFIFSALLFSTNQWENWLWAIQIIVFIPPLCLTNCLLIQRSNLTFPSKILLCAGLALISTFSYANGMVCWVLGFPWQNLVSHREHPERGLATTRKTRLVWSATYWALAIITLWRYFRNYVKPSHHPPLAYVLQHPSEGPHYLLTWLGSSFAQGTTVAPTSQAVLFGLFFVLLLLLLMFIVWRRRASLIQAQRWRALYPWIVIGSYGLFCGLVTTAGRLGIGIEQALASRYIAFSCYAWIGVIGALGVLEQPALAASLRGPSFRGPLASGLFGLLFACYLFDWYENTRSMRGHWAEQKNMALTVQFLSLIPDNPLLSHLLADPKLIRSVALPLMEKNILRPTPAGEWVWDKLKRPDGDSAGAFSTATQGSNIEVNGWTILPVQKKLPDAVLLAACSSDGKQRLITVVAPTSPRPDLVQASSRPSYLNCGFVATLPIATLGQDRLCLYALDFENHAVYSLQDTSPGMAQ
ncbi:MAG TPA: hypothetical protein VGW57_00270 [Chthoniobacterales bacterium]|nr:hypothetical protein [Chthoniobacterales bacterium]